MTVKDNATQTQPDAGARCYREHNEVCPDSTQGWREPAPAPTAKTWTDLLLEAWASGHTLPLDSQARKLFPVASGFEAYFPAAIAAVAAHSYASNQKHNPGQSLRWSQDKSPDHDDCIGRHRIDQREAARAHAELEETVAEVWRGLGKLQMLAQRHGAPIAPAGRVGK